MTSYRKLTLLKEHGQLVEADMLYGPSEPLKKRLEELRQEIDTLLMAEMEPGKDIAKK